MEDVIKLRQHAAKLIIDVILGHIKVLDALGQFPKNSDDDSVNVCFHILVHYEADEDMRAKDPLYKEVQDDFMVETAETLAKGNPLPYNIIQEYNDYYDNDLDLIYRELNKKNIIKRLLKPINL